MASGSKSDEVSDWQLLLGGGLTPQLWHMVPRS